MTSVFLPRPTAPLRLGGRLLFAWLLWGCALVASATQAAPRHYEVDVQTLINAQGGNYYVSLLTMILEASKAPGEEIVLHIADHQFSQARWIAEVQRSPGNHVMWTVTDRERETLLRPIPVPIFKGLEGKRMLVIRKEDQAKFAAITTARELRGLVAGQGAHWPDVDILKANGFAVMEGVNRDNLYKMLAARRFDYFPRGVTEIDSERSLIAQYGLMVEPSLVLSYPAAMYFFVNKNNTELAQRLEKGWEIILRNGAFDKFFYNHPRIKTALAKMKDQKHIIEMENPFGTPQ